MLSVLRSGVALLATVSLCESLFEDGSCSSSVELLQRGLVVDHAVKRPAPSGIAFRRYAKSLGSPTTQLRGRTARSVRPEVQWDGQYLKPVWMTDAEFLQDCIDVCAGDLDRDYCGGFAISNTGCFFYGAGVAPKGQGQGQSHSFTFYDKLVLGSTVCDFANRRKCQDYGGKPAGTVMMLRPDCRDHCIAQRVSGQHGCCQYDDMTRKCRFWSSAQEFQVDADYAKNLNKAAFIVDTCSAP